jgi:hypothetical protein
VSKLTADQKSFARSLNARQWGTLKSLAMFPFYLSATERGDPDLYALIRRGFAAAGSAAPDAPLFTWWATDAGKAAVREKERGDL